ncbi:unnamed protein product [Bursaphelenchus xylophilus]|uniref:(pine wood nematode) hypothetical protein n=1 Tax=Bursaphelenchus xylophilus TaxID=6326 RepID=A0A1I7S3K6_BURXY|nr:unnamed protein product [Bursaphelenchus xylophilus]CAG9116376.1 unnamed protein product [Bursaphelenchus xylophilus]
MPAPLNLDAKYTDALIQAILDRHAVLLEGNESRRLDRNRQRSQAWEEVKNLVQPMIDKPLTVEAVKSTFKHRQMKIKRMLQSIKDDNTDSDAWQRLPELSGLSQAETRLFHYLSSFQAPKEDTDLVVEEDAKGFPMNSSAILRSLLALDENENRPQKRNHEEDEASECSRKSAKHDGNTLMDLLTKNSPESSNEDSNNENAENNKEYDIESVISDKEFLSNFNIPHLSTALEVSATPINYASSNHSEQDSIVPEAVINAVVDRKAILLEDNMSRKACRNRQRCDAWEEVRQVAENASTSGSVTLDMVKGIFKYRQMKIRRIYEEYQNKTLDIQKYNLSEAEQRLFNWYCTYQPPTHHRSSNQSEPNANDSAQSERPKSPEINNFDSSNLLSFLNQPQNIPDVSILHLQKEVLQSQKELFVEQTKMCQALVTTLNGFVNWLNNNQLKNNHCKQCHSSG